MERDTIIAGAATAVAAAALILAGVTKASVTKMNKAVNFDTSVKVAEATPDDTASTETTESTDEQGAADGSTEGLTEADTVEGSSEETTSYTGKMELSVVDGAIKISDSTIKVPAPGTNGTEDVHDLYIYLPGDNTIKYDSTTNYLELNGSTVVRTISAVDATYEGISAFTDQDGQQVLIGEKLVDDTSAIAVVHTVPASGDGVNVDLAAETQTVQSILDGAHAKVTVTEASLFGYPINPEWVEDMVITSKGAELIKGDKAIYVAPYTGTFVQGTTNTLQAGSLSLTYADSAKDTSTGYTPYILSFSEKQDGTTSSSSSTLQAKILATSNLDIKDLFMAD